MSSALTVELETFRAEDGWPFVSVSPPSHQGSPNVLTEPTPISNPETVPHAESGETHVSNRRMVFIIATLSGINFLSNISTGMLTVGLPRMAADIELPAYLLLWPASVYALTSGSCLLLVGSIADVVGNRFINLAGCFMVGCFIIGCGLARSGIELIMFRALQGIAVSFCLPTSVSIVAHRTPSGRKRNIAFSILGFVQPIGFSLDLVLGGILLDTAGWRLGYYLCGSFSILFFFVGLWAVPSDRVVEGPKIMRLKKEIDWVGAGLSSTCLSLFSYVLATLTSSIANIRHPVNISLLSVSLALVPAFIFWEGRQERLGCPALIPNSLWKNRVFTSICLIVISSFAVVNAMELFCSFFFQNIQNLSALQASIRILPSLVVGAALQLTTGLLIHRVPAFYLVLASLILSAGAPLLMALTDANQPYWYNAFFAQLLAPDSADILFTIGLLVVSDVFPTSTQALAGAVFSTVSQFGTSIGLTVMAVISSSAIAKSNIQDKTSPDALLVGYRASFWTAFGWMSLACLISALGLRRIGKVGLKRD